MIMFSISQTSVILFVLLHPIVRTRDLPEEDTLSYEVLIDAGTTGSKVMVYTIQTQLQHGSVPDISRILRQKVRPGLWSLEGAALDTHIEEVMQISRDNVPEEAWDNTNLYVMATAGMRLILDSKADAIMERVNLILEDKDHNPFVYKEENTRILSGEEEGVFAWIAVNYLRGFFDIDSSVDSVGILELGGGSTQIAFIPDGQILADKFPVTVGGEDYSLYVHSYLYYGQDFAQRWVQEKLVRTHEGAITGPIDDPCMLQGDSRTKTTLNQEVTYSGTGDGEACEALLQNYVYEVPESRCYPKPCSIGPYYQPAIPEEKEFYAIAAFVFYPQALQVAGEDGVFQPQELRETALEYCGKSLEEAQTFTGDDTTAYLSMNCLMGLYVPLLFTKGYDFANDTQQISAVSSIEDERPDWTIGAIIYENERRTLDCPDIGEVSGGATCLHRQDIYKNVILMVLLIYIITYIK